MCRRYLLYAKRSRKENKILKYRRVSNAEIGPDQRWRTRNKCFAIRHSTRQSACPHHSEKRAMGERKGEGFVDFVWLPCLHMTASASQTQPKQSLQAGCIRVCSESGMTRCRARALTVVLLVRSINEYFRPAVIAQLLTTIGCTRLRNRGSGGV